MPFASFATTGQGDLPHRAENRGSRRWVAHAARFFPNTDLALKPGNSTVVIIAARRRSSVAAHHRRASQAAGSGAEAGSFRSGPNDKRAARLSSMIYIS